MDTNYESVYDTTTVEEVFIINEEDDETELLLSRSVQLPKNEDSKTASTFGTFFLIIKAYVGSGILGLPWGFRYGGVWPSCVTMLLLAILSFYCIHLLMECKRTIPKEVGATTYHDIAEYAMGSSRKWRNLVLGCVVYTQAGFCVVYMIFVGQTMNTLVPQLDVISWTAIFLPFFILVSLIRSYKNLEPTAVFANFAIWFACIAVLVYAFKLQVKSPASWEEINAVNWPKFPIFFGVALYTFEGIGVIVPMAEAMKHEEKFMPVLLGSYIFLVIFFCLFAVTVMLSFGDKIQAVVVESLPTQTFTWYSTQIALIPAIFFTFPVMLHPVSYIAENALHLTEKDTKKWIALRSAIVVLLAAIALGLPQFGLFISLIGSFGSSALMVIFPALFHIKLCSYKSGKLRIISSWFIVVFGVVGALASGGITLMEMIDLMKEGKFFVWHVT